ncbi:MAG: glycosyltransferase family 2 protein [Chlorobi bacterium]|nr:glycosyltransferase family 2 protein [Chlorobiota bacterium]
MTEERQDNPKKTSPESVNQKKSGRRYNRPSQLDLSIVIPLLNEKESLPELAEEIKAVCSQMNVRWEVWFIDDGSTDGSFDILRKLHRQDGRFRVIRFRRNYGKSAALAAGFKQARGKFVVTMDADLQDDPEEIPALLDKLEEGYDLVSGWKKKRYDPITKTIPSKFFNFVTGVLTGIRIHDFNCGLKAYRREVVKAVNVYGELHRYVPVLAKMAGFTVTEKVVQHHPRKYGKTKFGLSRFLKGFLDLVTVLFTSRYTQRPLHLFGTIGIVFVVLGLGINAYLTYVWIMGYPISNRPLLFLGILLIMVGFQLISTGLLAEMITKSQFNQHHVSTREILK